MNNALATVHRSRGWRTGMTAVMATGALLLLGCTGQRPVEAPPTTAPATSPASAAPERSDTPEASPEPEEIEFEFRRPDPICPPASAIDSLPLADQHPYSLIDPFLDDPSEGSDNFFVICDYRRSAIGDGDGDGDGEDMILEDHAGISVQIHLYRQWEGSPNADRDAAYPALPVRSADLDDWQVAAGIDHERVWWEGCGEETPCAEGEEPTVETRARQVEFTGHVGNLEFFNVTVTYIAQRLPADVERRTVEIFRDFVLAAMESYERAE